MEQINKCPKCGSTNLKWIHNGHKGYYLCNACGYAGSYVEKQDADPNPEISW